MNDNRECAVKVDNSHTLILWTGRVLLSSDNRVCVSHTSTLWNS